MDFVFWIILLVVLAAVLWWLVKRKSQTDGTGTPPNQKAAVDSTSGSAGATSATGKTMADAPAGNGAPMVTDRPAAGTSAENSDLSAAGAPTDTAGGLPVEQRRIQDEAEWETQWSETSGSAASGGSAASAGGSGSDSGGKAVPVHHPEFTAAQAPTLPGAETASAEDGLAANDGAEADEPAAEEPAAEELATADTATGRSMGSAAVEPGPATGLPNDAPAAETWERAQSSALVEAGASHSQEPAAAASAPTPAEPVGHLAAEQPYGTGSAAAAPDGAGPSGYTVKGDAAGMVYYEEGHPEYEQTRASVWFESAAHAEAAGFRAPRRKRLQ